MNNEIETIKNEWREAYRKANEKEPPEISYEKGWFTIHRRKHRKKEVLQFTKTLLASSTN
ncbi:hypothetical protein [Paenibacillus sp. 1P03SA]|uniref:hypothetical protein n=1 Tax=Paenibacillus sp. 1P03SA TaxID=3132294 RepID=UPI0039A2690F